MNTLIHTPTPQLAQSIDFYTRLGFTHLPHKDMTLFRDGNVIIQINPDRFARAGVVLYRENWKEVVVQLMTQTTVVETEDGYLLNDPSGVRIYLKEGKLDLPQEAAPSSVLGNLAGLSLETMDLHKSAQLWEVLGFKHTMGSAEQGWIVYQNEDQLGVSFMKPNTCPHLFFNPSLTYFNGGKNLPVIEKIRFLGLPITEEITVFNKEGIVDNVILRDPGGYGFFVFND